MTDPLEKVAALMNRPEVWDFAGARELLAGVDIGTYKTSLIVVDEAGRPRAGLMRRAEVVRSGLIVDYVGALNLVRELVAEVRARSPLPLAKGATAYPPQTESGNIHTTRYILESVGLEVQNVLDEPSAANQVLQMKRGAIVDVGGGTTGVAVIKNGRIVHTDDEATGGLHLTLVLAGGLKVGFEEAERIKADRSRRREVLALVRPVLDKISTIVAGVLRGRPEADRLCLVGGTTELEGLTEIVGQSVGLEAFRPAFPQMITPLGIALSGLEGNGHRSG
ncbi:MAG: ethanolamine utilization protein EutJ [Thermodesulfobacteriota bacterium]